MLFANYSETKEQLLILVTESAAWKAAQGRDCPPSQQGLISREIEDLNMMEKLLSVFPVHSHIPF